MKPLRLTFHAARTLWSQPVITTVVVACIAVGIAAFVAVLAMSRGMEKQVRKIMEGFGPRSYMVIATKAAGAQGVRPFWTPAQIDALRAELAGRSIVSGYKLRGDQPVSAGGASTLTSVYAIDIWLPELEDREYQSGSPLSDDDDRQLARVCVLGTTVAGKLFGNDDPVGREVVIAGSRFQVKGIAAKRGVSPLGLDMDDFVWIPLATGVKRLFHDDQIRALRMRTEVGVDPKAFPEDVAARLRTLHRLAPGAPDDFRIIASDEAARRHRDATAAARRGGWILSAISLVLGGVILANSLILSVNQRRAEFGLKRALGATKSSVFVELVVEALLICVAGLVAGALLGVLAVTAIARLQPQYPIALSWSAFAIGAAVSIVLGLLAGSLPGRAAVRIQPVAALR